MRQDIREIVSGEVTLSVQVTGTGPLVILMHGWPELGISWRHQIAPLAEAGFTVAVPDMRGFGRSSKPTAVTAYGKDAVADDMACIADALGHHRWVSVGHDAGSVAAWRTALRFPDRVAAVFSLSVMHAGLTPGPLSDMFDIAYPDRFFYMRYFQAVGVAEAELEQDVRASLKRIYFSLSGDSPKFDWTRHRPIDDKLLPGLTPPPMGGLSFMSDEVLDIYSEEFSRGGFFGPLSWYRNFRSDFSEQQAYGDGVIHQPSGFLCGDREILLDMFPSGLAMQREFLADLRREIILPDAGHWVQQERPSEVTQALLDFLTEVRPLID